MRSRQSITSNRSKRLSLALLVVLTAACAKAPPPTFPNAPSLPDPLQQLRSDIASLINQPGHQRATWGIAVRSLATGEHVFEVNSQSRLVPASALKIVTAAAAGVAVGWDYTFETTVAITGDVSNGVLNGDVVITGSGDPSIEGRGGIGFMSAFLAAFRDRGITRISGRVIGDDNHVEEPRPGLAWSWDDLGTVTGTLAGALNLRENTALVTVIPARTVGETTVWSVAPPDVRDLPIINRSMTVATGSSVGVWPERRPGESAVTIAGTLAITEPPRHLTVSVGNPTLWVARVLRTRLIESGIDVSDDAVDIDDLPVIPASRMTIVTYRSPPLRDIVTPMLKDSINMYAEAVLRLATGVSGARTTAAGAIAAERQLQVWGIPQDAVRMVDGSGLSRFNVATADAFVRVLAEMRDVAAFTEALPVAGVDGSLDNRLKDTLAAGNVRAKTGSMTHVRSLAGYVTTRDSEPLVFAIIVNNFEGMSATVINTIDGIVARLASFSRRAP